MQSNQRWLLFISSIGGILEFYDFIIYALFANYIAKAFFPEANEFSGLLITFATFAIGYLVRPLGGMIFGHFGDRIGRKSTFTISILLMATATLGIGLMPTYATIGITAPIAITIFRIIQGFSIGGEIPGAIAYVSESLPKRKGMACGIIFCSLLLGIVLGSLVQAAVASLFNEEQMQSVGWRVPFIIGGVVGLISAFLRRELSESAQFTALGNQVEPYPIAAVFRQELGHVLAGIIIAALCAAIVTALFLFIPAYFTKVLHFPSNIYVWERTAAITCSAALCLLFGYLADKMNVKSLMLSLGYLTILLAYPIFAIYAYYPKYHHLAFLASALLTGFSAGIIPCLLSELFPTKIRYSGVALSYNIGFALFGGLTPFISLSLIYYTGWITMPAFYLIIVSVLAVISLLNLKYDD